MAPRAPRRPWWARLPLVWLAAIALLGPGAPGLCAADARDPSLVVIFPQVTQAAVDHAIRTQLPPGGPRPKVLRAADPHFLDAYRRAGLGLEVGLDQADSELCLRGSPSFSALVKGAGESLEFLDLTQARSRITAARLAFTCGPEPASRETLARLLFLDGVLRTLEASNGIDLFEAALNVNSQMPFPAEQSAQVRAAFSQAVERRRLKPRVSVELPAPGRAGDQAGLTLRIDGVTASGSRTLPAGQHFLQWIDAGGQAIAGLGALLSPTSTGKAVTWPPNGVGPESRDAVLARLERAVASGRLEPDTRRAMQRLMAVQGYRETLLVDLEPASGASRTLRVDLEGRSEWGRQEPVASRSVVSPGIVATAALGAVTLASAGYYGYAYHRLATEQFADVSEGEALRLRGYTAGAVACVGLVGTGAAAGLVIWHPAGTQGPNRSETLIGLSLGPEMAMIQLGGMW